MTNGFRNYIRNLVNSQMKVRQNNPLYIIFQLKKFNFCTKVAHRISPFQTFDCLPNVFQIPHVIFETRSQFFQVLHHFVISLVKHKCKAELKGAHLRELKRELKRGLYPGHGGGRWGCFSLDTLTIALVCIFFLEFEPWLRKSEGFNN